MSDIAINVANLSKRYHIGKRERYKTFRDTLVDTVRAPLRIVRAVTRQPGPTTRESGDATIWALRDVSFDVKQGEVVGIVGRNGAGKSTLLKVLSRITRPTSGSITTRGRVGALLEVGTGFHPELTGRDNIYLNGAILGMRREEIASKFDEIVAFAEIEKFIDTPVKRYSSGMYMRLAFAVAAHLEPEVLIIDEVLAVGDAAFQKKCLGKMGDVAREGRTVLFVSHQLNQIRRLCEKVIWMDGGQVREVGSTATTMAAYEAATTSDRNTADVPASSYTARFQGWRIRNAPDDAPHMLISNGPCEVVFSLDVKAPIRHGFHAIALYNSDNVIMWCTSTNEFDVEPGITEVAYKLEGLPLRPGVYQWLVSIYDEHGQVDYWYAMPNLVIGTEYLAQAPDNWQGMLNIAWERAIH